MSEDHTFLSIFQKNWKQTFFSRKKNNISLILFQRLGYKKNDNPAGKFWTKDSTFPHVQKYWNFKFFVGESFFPKWVLWTRKKQFRKPAENFSATTPKDIARSISEKDNQKYLFQRTTFSSECSYQHVEWSCEKLADEVFEEDRNLFYSMYKKVS